MPVYDVTYKTLVHTQPEISTAADMGEYIPPKKRMELESNLSLTLDLGLSACAVPQTTPNISSAGEKRKKRQYNWSYQLLFVPHNPTTH